MVRITSAVNARSDKNIPFWKNIFRRRWKGSNIIIDILEKVPMFSTLTAGERKKIKLISFERSYKADEYLFKEGNPGSVMFIIKKGMISIERNTIKGELMHLASLTDGDFFGELALLDDSPRSASAQCIKDTDVVVLFRQDLFNLIDRNPVLGTKILLEMSKLIGERLKETNRVLIERLEILEQNK